MLSKISKMSTIVLLKKRNSFLRGVLLGDHLKSPLGFKLKCCTKKFGRMKKQIWMDS
jgi:hypothetical protein